MTSRYTHGHAESVLRSHRTRTAQNSAAYLLAELEPGMSVLDVGCGPGTITADLAEFVAPGRVTALETSDAVLAVARNEIERRGCDNVDYLAADVHALDLPDDSFDIVHAHQVLQHVSDPVTALREMIRVCRPGGVVAARDADYGAFCWYPANAGLDRWLELYQRAARANGGEPDAGRRMLSWARSAGAERIDVSSSTWCYADQEARNGWGLMWADRILNSAIAQQLIDSGLADRTELEQLSAAWQVWAEQPDGWFSLLHGEILIRV